MKRQQTAVQSPLQHGSEPLMCWHQGEGRRWRWDAEQVWQEDHLKPNNNRIRELQGYSAIATLTIFNFDNNGKSIAKTLYPTNLT